MVQARSEEIGAEIIEIEKQQADLLDAGKSTSASLDDKLEKLYREDVKICEDVKSIFVSASLCGIVRQH
jgi:SAGA-associated factor 29